MFHECKDKGLPGTGLLRPGRIITGSLPVGGVRSRCRRFGGCLTYISPSARSLPDEAYHATMRRLWSLPLLLGLSLVLPASAVIKGDPWSALLRLLALLWT